MSSAGTAIASISSAAATAQGSGRRATRRAQRAVSGVVGALAGAAYPARQQPAAGEPAEHRHQRQRRGQDGDDRDAVAKPKVEYVGGPARRSPISETSTVVAANTTERPAVAIARPAASATS